MVKTLHPKTGRLSRAFVVATWSLAAAWLLGRILDRLFAGNPGQASGHVPWPLELLTYLPPAPIIPAFVIAAGLVKGRRRFFCAAAASMLVIFIFASDMRRSAGDPLLEEPKGQVFELVHWNLFRDHLPWSKKISRLRNLGADIYIFNELPRHVTRGQSALRLGPNFTYAFGDLTGVGCRGRVLSHELRIEEDLIMLWVDCLIDGRTLRILAVDMPASPLVPRAPLIELLFQEMERKAPDLVAGDFNTPRRSAPLRRAPPGFRHAYEEVGSGWPYSWPMPFPFLAIDQCLTGPRILPHRLRYVGTFSSDHRLQKLEFSVRAPQTG